MQLNIFIDGRQHPIFVEEQLMSDSSPFFDKMDEDMSRGWQLGREWIEDPDAEARSQIVTERLVTALEHDNQQMYTMMAAYLLARKPGLVAVVVPVNGEIQELEYVIE